ncbi:MAG: hypothetical protein JO119_10205 [Acidobacteria bacterium]|nr:hypothetical protein [Acidobacteriota bacterium]
MISLSIWLVGIALELVLVLRGVQQGLLRRYPVFYSYIAFVVVSDTLLFAIQRAPSYLYLYWVIEFLGLLFGCFVFFEFYRVALKPYPGTARIARTLLAVLFVVAIVKTVVKTLDVPEWWMKTTPAQVEGLLRVCELLAILALTLLFLFYSIPFGRNLRGILIGYGLFVSWSVVCLALVAAGVAKSDSLWSYTFSISYVISVVVWTVSLWSYQPNPVPDRAIPLEQEYQRVAAATQRRLHTARGYLAKAVGS